MKTKPTGPWAAIDRLMKTEPEPTGWEWFTVQQFAARYGMSVPGAGQKLSRMLARGHLLHWKGVTSDSRKITNKYRLK